MTAARWTVVHRADAAHVLMLNGTACASIYHPFDPDEIAARLNDADTLTRARQLVAAVKAGERGPDGWFPELLDLLTGEGGGDA